MISDNHYTTETCFCLKEDSNLKISVLRNHNEDFRVNSVAGM